MESDFAEGSHVWIEFSLHNTVRDSFFHDGFNHGPGATDDELRLGFKASANLIENNIFWRQHTSLMLEFGASGNVIAYNYSTGQLPRGVATWQLEDFSFHGAHPMMNLFEGNITTHWQMDEIHGSSSHSTIFRSYSTGANVYLPPVDARGALQTGSPTQETANATAFVFSNVAVQQHGRRHRWVRHARRYAERGGEAVHPATPNTPACISVGYDDGDSVGLDRIRRHDDALRGRHGLHHAAPSSGSGAMQTLPASFYLSAQACWWGSEPWPPDRPGRDGRRLRRLGEHDGHGRARSRPPDPSSALLHLQHVQRNDEHGRPSMANVCYGTATAGDGGATSGGDGGATGGDDAGSMSSGDGGAMAVSDGGAIGDGGALGAGDGGGRASTGSSGGCSCRAGPGETSAPAMWLAASLGLSAARRRWRRGLGPRQTPGAARMNEAGRPVHEARSGPGTAAFALHDAAVPFPSFHCRCHSAG